MKQIKEKIYLGEVRDKYIKADKRGKTRKKVNCQKNIYNTKLL